jgi:hypothetical protein
LSQSFAERVVTTLADTAYTVFAIDVDCDGGKDALSASVSSPLPGAAMLLRSDAIACNICAPRST